MEASPIVEQTRWKEEVGVFDHKRMVGHEFHVAQRHACPERHVHTKADHAVAKGALKAFVSDDESLALQTDDTAVDHVEGDESIDGLIGVDKRQGKLITAANHAVAHALFFGYLLKSGGRSTPRIGGTRLCVTRGFSNHGQALLVSTEVETSAFE